MSENKRKAPSDDPRQNLKRIADQQVSRKLKAQSRKKRTVWSGLGMFGLVGWAIATPTLIGIAAGIWLDSNFSSGRSWTLTLLIAGLCLGCLNAWSWISKEIKNDD